MLDVSQQCETVDAWTHGRHVQGHVWLVFGPCTCRPRHVCRPEFELRLEFASNGSFGCRGYHISRYTRVIDTSFGKGPSASRTQFRRAGPTRHESRNASGGRLNGGHRKRTSNAVGFKQLGTFDPGQSQLFTLHCTCKCMRERL